MRLQRSRGLSAVRAAWLWIAFPLLAAAGDIRITHRYLHIPIAQGGELKTVHLLDGSRVVHYFQAALAADRKDPLLWTSLDVRDLKGRTITARIITPPQDKDLTLLFEQSDQVRKRPDLYREAYRPQFHFSAPIGWLNDPNGLVWQNGEYHMFYQHNPYGPESANKSWAHATSRDLVHWQDFGDVMLPDRLGAMYSGSAVIDHRNTAGFGKGALVAMYTTAGGHAPEKLPYTQSIAYSTDGGRTLVKYTGNPVLPHIADTNRDPKVFWHAETAKWIMVLYLTRGKFAIYGSGDLRNWEKLSDVDFPDGHECPELFPLDIDGKSGERRWIFWEGAGRHMIGKFDGKRFIPETGVLPSEWGPNCYAGQTWNDVPDGRRLYLCWMRAARSSSAADFAYPNMPFNQQMAFPRELSLKATPEGPRLAMQPAREIRLLHSREHKIPAGRLQPGQNPLATIAGELFDIEARLSPGEKGRVALDIRGHVLEYDQAAGTLSFLGKSVQIDKTTSPLDLRILVDRTSVEIFAFGGQRVMSFCFRPEPTNRSLSLVAINEPVDISLLRVHELNSALPAAR